MSTSSVAIPTMTDTNGTKEWYLNGERHREDGPAIERAIGTKAWYLHGKQISEEEHASQTALVKSAI
jgi:hypothetical protein